MVGILFIGIGVGMILGLLIPAILLIKEPTDD